MGRHGEVSGRRGGQRSLKQLSGGLRALAGQLSVAIAFLLILTIYLSYSSIGRNLTLSQSKIKVDDLWGTAPSGGWKPLSDPRSDWLPPPKESNGYLRVRCNGGLNQQRSAICNAVLAARIMNATLVLPELDTNSFWHDDSGFPGIYDVKHFIKSLRYDVRIVESLPEFHSHGKTGKAKKMKAHQLRPPRDAPLSWYTTVALEKMKEHGAIYLTPFSHRLAEEIDKPEYQRLRCRVNYHALRFKPHIMKISRSIVNRLRAQGHFMAIHLRFEMDMLAFAGCIDIFTPEEQNILRKYRKENFAEKNLVYSERKAIGKCPLTPEEVSPVHRSSSDGWAFYRGAMFLGIGVDERRIKKHWILDKKDLKGISGFVSSHFSDILCIPHLWYWRASEFKIKREVGLNTLSLAYTTLYTIMEERSPTHWWRTNGKAYSFHSTTRD